ncbi:pyridoxal phosphate-dependent deaminase, putative, partial [hydrothermal vent metagenome]
MIFMGMNKLNKWQELFCSKLTPVTQLADFKSVKIWIKRDDLNHQIVQGNKLRKLKYNLEYAIKNSYTQLVTF